MEDFEIEVEFQSETIGKYEFVLREKILCFYQSKAMVWYRINAAYLQDNLKQNTKRLSTCTPGECCWLTEGLDPHFQKDYQ